MKRAVLVLLAVLACRPPEPAPGPEALLVIAGDQHSAYERTAQIVAAVDRLATQHPGLPMATPAAWARANLPTLLGAAPVPIVLSHAGLKADGDMLPIVPDGTLFVRATRWRIQRRRRSPDGATDARRLMDEFRVEGARACG